MTAPIDSAVDQSAARHFLELVERLNAGPTDVTVAEAFDEEVNRLPEVSADFVGPAFYRAALSAVSLLDSATMALWRFAIHQVESKHEIGLVPPTLDPGRVAAISTDELCLRSLRCSINTSLRFEDCLRALRSWFVCEIEHDAGSFDRARPLAVALAHQSVNNEYLWEASAEEELAIDRLVGLCREQIDAGDDVAVEPLLLVLCQYRPLEAVGRSTALMNRSRWKPDVLSLTDRTVAQPLLERDLQSRLGGVRPNLPPDTAAVARQYDENPYPRWLRLGPRGRTIAQQIAYMGGPALSEEPRRILVAGCGSGRHPLRLAAAHPHAEVVALDVSAVALAHAARRSTELGLTNVTFVQGDLLDSQVLTERFQHIECAGVLHHIVDHRRAWRVLREALCPGGTMRVDVYGSVARIHVKYARAVLRAGDRWATLQDIREARRRVLSDPCLTAVRPALVQAADFFTTSMFRDFLLHVYEHHYSLEELEEITSDLDLDFIAARIPKEIRARVEGRTPCRAIGSFQDWRAVEWAYSGTGAMFTFWLRNRTDAGASTMGEA